MSGVLSPWANSPRLGLIGNPENRRIVDFQKAVEVLGWPCPPCLSYEDLCSSPEKLPSLNVEFLRIDSPGENERVATRLIALGGGPVQADLEFGEIAYTKEYHRGFCEILNRIERQGIPCLNAPRDIAMMFDKWECHRLFTEKEIARPRSELAPGSFEELWETIRTRGSGQVFLKPLHGSSASGVCALRWTRKQHQLFAPLRTLNRGSRTQLVNCLKVGAFTDLAEIESILNQLLPHGMIMEEWIPKLTLPGGAIDLRVLVIAGEARHWVIRQSRSPMTNLHLGNQRGDEGELLNVIGRANLDRAFRLAERAAACFPDSLSAGVDVLIDSRHQPWIGEINAFGDLLPRLTHRGESAFTAIARACNDQHCAV